MRAMREHRTESLVKVFGVGADDRNVLVDARRENGRVHHTDPGNGFACYVQKYVLFLDIYTTVQLACLLIVDERKATMFKLEVQHVLTSD